MNNFYLKWSYEEPKNPKEIYGISWDTGISWYGQINRSNQSLEEFKIDKIKMYERLISEYKKEGKTMKLFNKYHLTDEQKKVISKETDFIKWVL